MTNAEKNIREIERLLNQYADGWCFVGFNPKDGEPIMACSYTDAKTEIALNSILGGMLSNGGVQALKARMAQSNETGEDEAGTVKE
jgi:hypothetical protein